MQGCHPHSSQLPRASLYIRTLTSTPVKYSGAHRHRLTTPPQLRYPLVIGYPNNSRCHLQTSVLYPDQLGPSLPLTVSIASRWWRYRPLTVYNDTSCPRLTQQRISKPSNILITSSWDTLRLALGLQSQIESCIHRGQPESLHRILPFWLDSSP